MVYSSLDCNKFVHEPWTFFLVRNRHEVPDLTHRFPMEPISGSLEVSESRYSPNQIFSCNIYRTDSCIALGLWYFVLTINSLNSTYNVCIVNYENPTYTLTRHITPRSVHQWPLLTVRGKGTSLILCET